MVPCACVSTPYTLRQNPCACQCRHAPMHIADLHPLQAGFSVLGGYMSPVNDRYGKAGLAPAPDRIAMCQLAAADSSHISVDLWEASQDTAQRSLTVLQRIAGLLQVWPRCTRLCCINAAAEQLLPLRQLNIISWQGCVLHNRAAFVCDT